MGFCDSAEPDKNKWKGYKISEFLELLCLTVSFTQEKKSQKPVVV